MRPGRRGTKELASASGAVASWLHSQELAQALRPHMAKARWAGVVGPQVAAVTQVEAVREGILFVRVKNSVWANELTLMREDMVRRLNLTLGGRVITDIHFKAGGLRRGKEKPPQEPPPAPTEADLARIVLSAEVRARVEAKARGITEERLRERIRTSLLRVARIEEWKRRHGWHPCLGCGTLPPPHSSPEIFLCSLCRAGVNT